MTLGAGCPSHIHCCLSAIGQLHSGRKIGPEIRIEDAEWPRYMERNFPDHCFSSSNFDSCMSESSGEWKVLASSQLGDARLAVTTF